MKKFLTLLIFSYLISINALFLRASDANGPAGINDDEQVVDLDGPEHERYSHDKDGEWDDYGEAWETDYNAEEENELEEEEDDDSKSLEDYGEEMDDPTLMQAIWNYVSDAIMTEQTYILSKPGEDADCYAINNVKCAFAIEEYPVKFVVEYEPEPEEYQLTVKRDMPDTEVMRRRLKANNCDEFDEVFSLWNRDISCEIKEYAHVITIKHIG